MHGLFQTELSATRKSWFCFTISIDCEQLNQKWRLRERESREKTKWCLSLSRCSWFHFIKKVSFISDEVEKTKRKKNLARVCVFFFFDKQQYQIHSPYSTTTFLSLIIAVKSMTKMSVFGIICNRDLIFSNKRILVSTLKMRWLSQARITRMLPLFKELT